MAFARRKAGKTCEVRGSTDFSGRLGGKRSMKKFSAVNQQDRSQTRVFRVPWRATRPERFKAVRQRTVFSGRNHEIPHEISSPAGMNYANAPLEGRPKFMFRKKKVSPSRIFW